MLLNYWNYTRETLLFNNVLNIQPRKIFPHFYIRKKNFLFSILIFTEIYCLVYRETY